MTISNRQIQVGPLAFDAATAGEAGRPLVLFLHGFPQTKHAWRNQLPAVAEAGYFAVAPDQRGYSPAARPQGVEAYRADLITADALGIIETLGYSKAHVVGHDWGGSISWMLAMNHPAQVISLTVLSRPHPAAFAWAMGNDSSQATRSRHHQAFQDPATVTRLLEDNARRLRAALTGHGVPGDDADAYLKVLGEADALEAALNWYRARGDTTRVTASKAPAVTVPTLYLWGTSDHTVGRMAAEKTRDYVTGPFRFVELDGIGHFITDQVVSEVNVPLIEHLNAHSPR